LVVKLARRIRISSGKELPKKMAPKNRKNARQRQLDSYEVKPSGAVIWVEKTIQMGLNDRGGIGDGGRLLSRKRNVRSRERRRRWNSAPTTCSARLVSAVRCYFTTSLSRRR